MSQRGIKFKSSIIESVCLFGNRGSPFLKFLTKNEFPFSKLCVRACAHTGKGQESTWVFAHSWVYLCVRVILQQKE